MGQLETLGTQMGYSIKVLFCLSKKNYFFVGIYLFTNLFFCKNQLSKEQIAKRTKNHVNLILE